MPRGDAPCAPSLEDLASELAAGKRKLEALNEEIESAEMALKKAVVLELNWHVANVLAVQKLGTPDIESIPLDLINFGFHLENGGFLRRGHDSRCGFFRVSSWAYAPVDGHRPEALGYRDLTRDVSSGQQQSIMKIVHDTQQSFGLGNLARLAQIEKEFAKFLVARDEVELSYEPVKATEETAKYTVYEV